MRQRIVLSLTTLALIVLVCVNLAPHVTHTHFEDGSGILTLGHSVYIEYCLPFTLCDVNFADYADID